MVVGTRSFLTPHVIGLAQTTAAWAKCKGTALGILFIPIPALSLFLAVSVIEIKCSTINFL